MRNAIVIAILMVLAACATSTHDSGHTPTGRSTERATSIEQGPQRAPDDVSYLRKRGDVPGDGLLGPGLFALLEPSWFELKRRIKKSSGFSFGMAYTALGQHATDSLVGQPDHAGGGDLDLFGTWQLVGDDSGNAGIFGFAFEDRHRYTSIAPADLDDAIGSLWPTTRAFDTHPFGLNQIYWDQHLFDNALEIRLGAYDHNTIYEQYIFRSEVLYFENLMFSGNVSFKPPAGGFGGVVTWRPTPELYAIAGIADANGQRIWPELGSFFNDREYYYFLEAGYSPRFGEDDVMHVQATAWYVDAREEAGIASGSGVAINLQYAHEDWIPFLRYAYADADAATVDARQNVNGGLGIMRPFGRADDVFAIAAGAGQEVGGSRWQAATEAFYRVQLTSYTQLTLSIQGIFHPLFNPARDVLGVFGLRLRFQL